MGATETESIAKQLKGSLHDGEAFTIQGDELSQTLGSSSCEIVIDCDLNGPGFSISLRAPGEDPPGMSFYVLRHMRGAKDPHPKTVSEVSLVRPNCGAAIAPFR